MESLTSAQIERMIYLIRGHKVMLDSDLAELYKVTTGRLNEQVKSNIDRFQPDFMFQISEKEFVEFRLFVGNIYDLPFCDSSFDAVFSVALWHLLSDVKKAASELNRVLRKDGSFLIVTADPSSYSSWTAPYIEVKSNGERFEGKVKHSDGTTSTDVLFLYTDDQISNSLKSNNLVIQKTEKFRNFVALQGQKISSK